MTLALETHKNAENKKMFFCIHE